MASNIAVRVSADTTQLTSQSAIAQATVKQLSTAVRAAAQEIAQSGAATDVQKVALENLVVKANAAKAAYVDLQKAASASSASSATVASGLDQVAKSAEGAAHGSAGVARELLVMTHESIMGNFTRLGGSMMVLAERTNALHAVTQLLTPAMMGVAGAVVAAGAALAYVVVQAAHAETALRGVYNAALLQGRGAAAAEANTKAFADQMAATGTVGGKASIEIASAIQTIPGVAEDVRAKLATLGPAMFETWGRNGEETAKKIDEAFRSTGSLSSFLAENHLLTSSQQEAFKAAESTHDAYTAQRIAVDALTARLGPAYEAFKKQTDEAKLFQSIQNSMGAEGAGIADQLMPNAPRMPPLRMPDVGSKAEDETTTRQTEAVERYNQAIREKAELVSDAGLIQQRIAAATTDADRQEAEAALKVNQTRQAMLKDPGDASWSAKIATQAKEAGDAAVVAAHDAGQKRTQITEAGTRAEMAVYKAASMDMTRTDAERLDAKREAISLEMSLVKSEAGSEAASAKQGYEAKVAQYDADIGAAKGNVAQIESLEKQKLDYIKGVRGESSAAYQDALKSETEAVSAAVSEQVRRIKTAGEQSLSDKKSVLALEAASHQITKSDELQQELGFVKAQEDADVQALSDLMAILPQGTAAWKEAVDARTALITRFGTEMNAVNAKIVTDTNSTTDKMTKSYEQAFSSIGSASERAVTGMVMGTETFRKAEVQVASAVVSSFLQMTLKMVEQYAVSTVDRVFLENSAQTAISEAQKTGGTGFTQLIEQMMTKQATSQSAQVSAVVVGQGAQTAAVASGSAAQSAAQGAAGGTMVMADAAKAASGAYASASQVPYVGWILGPIAAAGAFTAVAAYEGMASLDVGTVGLPADMVAQVHQGEMIVPAFESSMIRSGQATLGAGGGGENGAAGAGGAGGASGAPAVTFNVQAIDAQGVAAFFNKYGRQISAQVGRQSTMNASLRPAY